MTVKTKAFIKAQVDITIWDGAVVSNEKAKELAQKAYDTKEIIFDIDDNRKVIEVTMSKVESDKEDLKFYIGLKEKKQ